MNEWTYEQISEWTSTWDRLLFSHGLPDGRATKYSGNQIQILCYISAVCWELWSNIRNTVTKRENFYYLVLIMKQWQSIWDIKSMFYFHYRFWFSMCFYLLNSLIPYFTEVRLTEPKTKWLFLNSESQTFLIYFHRERKFWTLDFIEREKKFFFNLFSVSKLSHCKGRTKLESLSLGFLIKAVEEKMEQCKKSPFNSKGKDNPSVLE